MKYSGHRKLLCEFSKLNAFNSDTDASILVYKFRPEITGFNMYAEYTRPQLTFLALVPWTTLTIVTSKLFKGIVSLPQTLIL